MLTCQLCPHHCKLAEGQVGYCRIRRNDGGVVRSLSYGQVTSLALDPIEKKPLYHFYPGTVILSVGSFGCNMRCPFCQNYSISQDDGGEVQGYLAPEKLAELAVEAQKQHGSIGVAFTYNEPLLSFEYLLDVAPLLRAAGQKVVLVSNGQIEAGPLRKLLPLLDAANIDLKAFNAATYQWMGGSLEAAQRTIRMMAEAGVHVEVTTLVIPGKNDGMEEFRAETEWLAGISPEIPLHLSRYFPRYQCAIEMTPLATLQQLQKVTQERLQYVYLGNVR